MDSSASSRRAPDGMTALRGIRVLAAVAVGLDVAVLLAGTIMGGFSVGVGGTALGEGAGAHEATRIRNPNPTV